MPPKARSPIIFGSFAAAVLFFGLEGMGMGSRGPDATPGPWGLYVDNAAFWVPVLLISAVSYGWGFYLWRGRKVGIVVAVAWIVLWLLLMVATEMFE